jgi:two-component system cell cycle sensor histidine kinase/response regulator CckA
LEYMLALSQPYGLLLIFSVIIPAALAVAILNHRPSLGSRAFFFLMASVALWALMNLFEVCSSDVQTKIFSFQVKHLFIVTAPVSWLAFCLYYSNCIRSLQWHQLLLLLVVPVVTMGLVGTNAHHQLMFRQADLLAASGYALISPRHGPFFWFHIAYGTLLLLIGFIFLVRPLFGGPAHYRRQAIPLLAGGLIPWVSNALSVFKVGTFDHFDLTAAALTVSGIAFMWGILRYHLLDIVPIARDVIIHNIKDAIVVVDSAGYIIDLNEKASKLAQVEKDDVIGARAAHLIGWWPDLSSSDPIEGQRELPPLELQVGHQRRICQVTDTPLHANGKPLGHLITVHDATDMQMTQLALRESEERFKSMSENAPIIIFSQDENGTISYVNPAWQAILGHDRKGVVGTAFIDFIADEDRTAVLACFRQLIQGKLATAEIRMHAVHQNGTRRLFETIAAANSNVEGRVTGIIGLAKDITEERQLQRQLLQSQKMEAVGTLAGGIAHDFNNLLMGIQANVSLIRLGAGRDETVEKKVARIEEQIQNGAALTRQLLGYARKGKYSVTTFNLNLLIEETLHVVRRTNKGVVVHSRLTDAPAMIQADQGQMELVLLNLFLNAVDAMPGGGELHVKTQRLNAGEHRKIQLQVADTGVGMDKETQGRIFEPFFTTKEMGQGTGLGMASVYGVVKNHGGDIQVQSEPNQGTAFTLTLPAVDQVPERCENPKSGEPQGLGSGTVLLVDDEALILKYCQEMISSLGFTVVSTQNSIEAIDLFKQQPGGFDLVILDMVMPGMNGLELFYALEKIDPQLKVIITTGYAVDDRISKLVAGGRHGCLRKPYGRSDLSEMITQILSRMPSGMTCKTGDEAPPRMPLKRAVTPH